VRAWNRDSQERARLEQQDATQLPATDGLAKDASLRARKLIQECRQEAVAVGEGYISVVDRRIAQIGHDAAGLTGERCRIVTLSVGKFRDDVIAAVENRAVLHAFGPRPRQAVKIAVTAVRLDRHVGKIGKPQKRTIGGKTGSIRRKLIQISL